MLYGYCVRLGSDPPPEGGTAGIEEGPVRVHGCGDLAVWVSEVQVPLEPSVERLREHDRVVRQALLTATPLPLRFGTVFRSDGELEQAVDARRDEFRRILDRVAGLAEMVIRVERREVEPRESPFEPPEPVRTSPGTPGRDYLERSRARLQSRERALHDAEKLLTGVTNELGGLAVETTVTSAGEGRLVGRVACLVRRGDVAAFRQRVTGALQEGRSELAFHVTGPWAPYSFADE